MIFIDMGYDGAEEQSNFFDNIPSKVKQQSYAIWIGTRDKNSG